MQFLKRILGGLQKQPDKIFVLGLDGLGLNSLNLLGQGLNMPTLERILKSGAITRLTTPLPTESQVAWASFATGQNPGRHGVFGLVDRNPDPFTTYISSADSLSSPTIWDILTSAQKSMGVMNVPLTYPPQPLNGIMVGCSLTPGLNLAHAVWPMELAPRLMEMDYRIEANNMLALSQPLEFLDDLTQTMHSRFRAAWQLMQSEPWSYWQLHDVTLDRLHRFFNVLPAIAGQDELAQQIVHIHTRLDVCLAELLSHLPPDCRLVIISTHGFIPCRASFMLNYWLEQNGYLHFAKKQKNLDNLHSNTRAYSLAPGRVYINLQGREQMGSVKPGQEYDELRQELINRLSGLSLPNSQEPVLRKIHLREDIYTGPELAMAPDLILEPMPGFDLRSNLNASALWQQPMQAALPLAEEGFVFIQNMKTTENNAEIDITDLAPSLLDMMSVSWSGGMDGHSRA